MLLRLVVLATMWLAFASGIALASAGTAYTGGSPKATHEMQIYLYLRPHHRAEWRVDIEGPCSKGSKMGRSIGTDVSIREPVLHLRHGRFMLHRSNTVETTGIHYRYMLRGHRIGAGFAGTLRYVEQDGIYSPNAETCDSTLLHWTAHRGGIFP
jgi:hypothetical protein